MADVIGRRNSSFREVRWFRRQDLAFAHPCPASWLPTVAHDVTTAGAKQYCRVGYEEFFEVSRETDISRRCYYEIILPLLLTHLYVDIDMDRTQNPGVDPSQISSLFERRVREFVIETMPGHGCCGEIRFVCLDSSTETKMSLHYIIKFERACFRNNYHCGAFMRRLVRFLVERDGDIDRNPFFANPRVRDADLKRKRSPDTGKECIIDTGVYTRNRAWRCPDSHKAGEDPTKRTLVLRGGAVFSRKTFLDCLVQYFPDVTRLRWMICMREWDGTEPTSTSHQWAHLDRGGPVRPRQINPGRTKPEKPAGSSSDDSQTVVPPEVIDDIVSEIAPIYADGVGDGGVIVRNSEYFSSSGRLCLYTRSKRCLIAGRIHQSNNVYIVVDFGSGSWCQKCTDLDCSLGGQRTDPRQLPMPLADRCFRFHTGEEEDQLISVESLYRNLRSDGGRAME